jgi:hypothetical protein
VVVYVMKIFVRSVVRGVSFKFVYSLRFITTRIPARLLCIVPIFVR